MSPHSPLEVFVLRSSHPSSPGSRRVDIIRRASVVWLISVCSASSLVAQAASSGARTSPISVDGDWRSYGRDPGGARYSPLTQINRESVARLGVAWRFSTGEAAPQYATGRRTSFEATPLVISGRMYLSTPLGRVFALDAATGRELWRFNASVVRVAEFGDWTSRGVSYWIDASSRSNDACHARIIVATI